MAGKQIGGEGLPANIAGMSKNQLYEIMSQMKALSLSIFYFISFSFTLIEQNQQQAKEILIQNPLLTKALFQLVTKNPSNWDTEYGCIQEPLWCTVENLLELPCLNRLLFVLLQAQIMLGMVKPPQVVCFFISAKLS
ncbi:hypothetical protein Goshw_015369 [Gossypium schwendimanii]|uniref:Uncharacterized protein n=1 Tax=Gossypium schwendimanii TaxID=34291 RepID=A0A7J9L3K3_GOSSC|nr:hypothetical protein [Gossypium schwendimanii]